MKPFRIAIFASGNGSNAEQILKYFQHHRSISVAVVLSNNPQAYVLERAKKFSIPALAFSRQEFNEPSHILNLLHQHGVTHIVLAGFLWLIPPYLIHAYPDKIVNIHPALLPKFGGKGMYGIKVHEAVRASAETETGITIHLVNEHYDEGKILFQGKCQVDQHYTAQQIAECVLKLEHDHYPKVIERWISGERQ